MKKTILLVDDEFLARQRLQKMLADIDGFEVVGEAENGDQALARVAELDPDIVLLDVRMPGVDGMQVAEQLQKPESGFHGAIIFTTAYDEYAMEAFDVYAAGYLLKPINREKLEKALHKAALLAKTPPSDGPNEDGRQHLSASSRGNVELIALDDVRILMAEHKYVTVFHTHGESILDESLKALEEEFPNRFIRVHRNALVSVKDIVALEKNRQGQYEVKVADTDLRPVVSRRLVTRVRNWMKQL